MSTQNEGISKIEPYRNRTVVATILGGKSDKSTSSNNNDKSVAATTAKQLINKYKK